MGQAGATRAGHNVVEIETGGQIWPPILIIR